VPNSELDTFFVYGYIIAALSALTGSCNGSGENLCVHPLEDVGVTLGSYGTTTVVGRLHVVVLLL
jgi:hypothetical protein